MDVPGYWEIFYALMEVLERLKASPNDNADKIGMMERSIDNVILLVRAEAARAAREAARTARAARRPRRN
jgi:hypothetical protein